MSLAKIGDEMLPNVYIKNIEIFDESDLEYGFRVHVYTMDSASEKRWSREGQLSKHLNILFYTSINSLVNDRIRTAQMDFNLENLRRGTDRKSGKLSKKDFFIEKRNLLLSENKSFGGMLYYNNYFEFKFPKNLMDLDLFCCVYVDQTEALRDLNFVGRKSETTYRGPITSDSVFRHGELITKSSIFIDSMDQQWFGPVHLHGDKYMAGSFHSSKPHSVLNKIDITNYKIKDYRKKLYTKDRKIDKSSYYIFKDFFTSHNHDKNVSGFFALNIEDLLVKETKYGDLLKSMSPQILRNLILDFKVKNMSIMRNRIKTTFETSDVNNISLREEKTVKSEILVKAGYSGNFISGVRRKNTKPFGMQRFIDDESTVLERPPDEPPRDLQSSKPNSTVAEEGFEDISFLQEINLNHSDKIKYYEFSDYELNYNSPGSYKYSLSIMFEDPTVEYISSLIKNIRNLENILTTYHFDMSKRKFYSYELDRPNGRFKDYYNTKLWNGQKLWIEATRIYVEAFSLLYNLTKSEKEDLIFSSISKIIPTCASLRSVNSFIKDVENLTSKVIDYFDIKVDIFRTHNLKSLPKQVHSTKTLISKEYSFQDIIIPTEYKDTYNIINFSDSSGLPKISSSRYKNRIKSEISKFYKKSKKQYAKTSKKSLDNALLDTQKTSAKYFSPISIQNRQQEISLKSPETSDIEKINTFFSNRKITKSSKVKNSQQQILENSNYDIFVEPLGLDEDLIVLDDSQEVEKYIVSKEYLGKIIDYTEVEPEYKIADDSSGPKGTLLSNVRDKINNPLKRAFSKDKFSLNKPDSFLTPLKNKIDPSSLNAFVRNIPNSIKVLFASDSNDVKNNYSKSKKDVYKDSETRNVVNINHLKVAKVEYFIGFEKGKNGNIILNKPKFVPLTDAALNLPGPKLCRTSWYSNKHLKIDSDNLTMPISNANFFITEGNSLNTPINKTFPEWEEYIVSVSNNLNYMMSNYDMDASKSNIIKQYSNKFVKIEKDTTSSTQVTTPTPTDTPTTPTTVRTQTGGRMTGGSY